MKKILFCITSRADFSLAYPIIKEFKNFKKFKILISTSGYLSGNKYGKKIKLIKDKIKKVDFEIKNHPLDDNSFEITKSLSKGILSFSNIFKKKKPDFIFVFADKYEMLAPVIASLQYSIPICHVEGGDITEGAIDDNIRHSITKLSHLHFVSTEEYKNRLIQLGEEKWRIKNVGSPSLDLIKQINFKTRNELSKIYNFDAKKDFILCTFHPVTNEINNTSKYISNLLQSLKNKKFTIIFTSPNADQSRSIITKQIKKFVKKNKNSLYIEKQPYVDYLSLMKHSNFMIGNSSSGIIESATTKTKVINVGNRQKGRIMPRNVINSKHDFTDIKKKISQISKLRVKFNNPYYKKNSSLKILRFFVKNSNRGILTKKFYDIK